VGKNIKQEYKKRSILLKKKTLLIIYLLVGMVFLLSLVRDSSAASLIGSKATSNGTAVVTQTKEVLVGMLAVIVLKDGNLYDYFVEEYEPCQVEEGCVFIIQEVIGIYDGIPLACVVSLEDGSVYHTLLVKNWWIVEEGLEG
jgi:hypothetical protein